MALQHKQRLFVDAYLGEANGNATKAAKIAGYSERTARSIGQENLTKPNIQAEIKRFYEEKAMPAEEVLGRLAEQARGVGGYLASTNGRVTVQVDDLLADGKGHLVKGVKETEHGQNVEFYDAQAALVHIGRNQKLFTDRVESENHTTLTYDDLSDEELDAELAKAQAREAETTPSEIS